MRLKYIVTDSGSFALFSETCVHADMARGMYGKPAGAGFARLFVDDEVENIEEVKLKIVCGGESVSLGIKSREEDEKIINRALNKQY